jgi:PIN domain nuclease of toxin-antitoxin system
MRLLLDTNAFLWFINDSPQLSLRAKALLESDADLLLSIASLWEIAIKTSIGKLILTQPYDLFIPQQLAHNAIDILPISLAHLTVVSALPLHHRDPFDRLLIAQAMIEQLPVVSVDAAFDGYPINRLWISDQPIMVADENV